MKYLIFILFLISCNEATEKNDAQPSIYSANGMSDVKVFVIDSCEYLGKLRGANSDILTHKGNCIYCTKRNLK